MGRTQREWLTLARQALPRLRCGQRVKHELRRLCETRSERRQFLRALRTAAGGEDAWMTLLTEGRHTRRLAEVQRARRQRSDA